MSLIRNIKLRERHSAFLKWYATVHSEERGCHSEVGLVSLTVPYDSLKLGPS